MGAHPPQSSVGGAASTRVLQRYLLSNGSGARPTDIVAIFGFGSREARGVVPVGWIYVNRRDEAFLEVRKGAHGRAAQSLREAGATASADVAELLEPYTYAEIPAFETRGLIDRLSLTAEVFRCFTRPPA